MTTNILEALWLAIQWLTISFVLGGFTGIALFAALQGFRTCIYFTKKIDALFPTSKSKLPKSSAPAVTSSDEVVRKAVAKFVEDEGRNPTPNFLKRFSRRS